MSVERVSGAFNSKRLFAPQFAMVIPNRFPILFGWQEQVAFAVVFVGNPNELSKPAKSGAQGREFFVPSVGNIVAPH